VWLLFSCQPLPEQAAPSPEPEPQKVEETGQPAQEPETGQEEETDEFAPKNLYGSLDTGTQRDYFLKGVEHYQQQQYLQAEFYFNKIKDQYTILQDHIYYYLAKSLLLQEKYGLSQQYYYTLIQDYQESIWAEKAALEYADLLFIQNDYPQAETWYQQFLNQYPESSYAAYGRFQLGFCQEKNSNIEKAYENYRQVWLNYPTNEYAEIAFSSLSRLIEEGQPEFFPTPEQLYQRGETFFQSYSYYQALDQLNQVLQHPEADTQIKAKALFRIGMCYYNLRDYSQSEQYLLQCYQAPAPNDLADDSLYFLGRVATNLGLNQEAIDYYQKLIDQYPQSNLSDDALYRIGRIYFFEDQMDLAIKHYQQVIDQYPSGDRLSEVLWELGWIHYSSQEWNQAKDIFAQMAGSFKSTELEEKGLFWQARCLQKQGQGQAAAELLGQIVGLNSYSYYAFAAQDLLAQANIAGYLPAIDKSANPFNPEIKQVVPQVYEPLEDESAGMEEAWHIKKALELLKIGIKDSAALEITAGQQEVDNNPVQLLMLSTLYQQSQDYTDSISILSRHLSSLNYGLKDSYRDYYYYLMHPYAYQDLVEKYAYKYHIDPLFVLSVMRQESRFQADAGSYAGARGLMQIMPATGGGIAQDLGLQGYDADQLFDPEISINMGSYYLSQQLNGFGDNKFYASGAYNGGPGAMASWVSRWGDKDIHEFVENIPYDETRDYVKKVMANYYMYQLLYN
ncbi:MAG: transglycosylase SLT domain-containing protein, partial [Actinomycetota bacterium]|nr:transglycosylase SLT domain-containing protein [Actinomycetota bacterium]